MSTHGLCVPLGFFIQACGEAAVASSNRAVALTERAEKAEAERDAALEKLAWAQIVAEVDGYLEGDAPPSQPGLFATGGLLQPSCQCKECTQ